MLRFLRWFDSNPVFWTFMLGVIAVGDMIALWNWVTISPKGYFGLSSNIFMTVVTVPIFLRMRRSR
jgi:hypothetical protein